MIKTWWRAIVAFCTTPDAYGGAFVSTDACTSCGAEWVACSWDLGEGVGPCCGACSHIAQTTQEGVTQ